MPGTIGASGAPSSSAGLRLLLGVGLLALVLVLLSIPLVIAARGARSRRNSRAAGASPAAPPLDAWAESARRMGGPS